MPLRRRQRFSWPHISARLLSALLVESQERDAPRNELKASDNRVTTSAARSGFRAPGAYQLNVLATTWTQVHPTAVALGAFDSRQRYHVFIDLRAIGCHRVPRAPRQKKPITKQDTGGAGIWARSRTRAPWAHRPAAVGLVVAPTGPHSSAHKPIAVPILHVFPIVVEQIPGPGFTGIIASFLWGQRTDDDRAGFYRCHSRGGVEISGGSSGTPHQIWNRSRQEMSEVKVNECTWAGMPAGRNGIWAWLSERPSCPRVMHGASESCGSPYLLPEINTNFQLHVRGNQVARIDWLSVGKPGILQEVTDRRTQFNRISST